MKLSANNSKSTFQRTESTASTRSISSSSSVSSDETETDLLKLLAVDSKHIRAHKQLTFREYLSDPNIKAQDILKRVEIIVREDFSDIPENMRELICNLAGLCANREPDKLFQDQLIEKEIMRFLEQEGLLQELDKTHIENFTLAVLEHTGDIRIEFLEENIKPLIQNLILKTQHSLFLKSYSWQTMKSQVEKYVVHTMNSHGLQDSENLPIQRIVSEEIERAREYDLTKFKAHKKEPDRRLEETQIKTQDGTVYSLIKMPNNKQKDEILKKLGYLEDRKNLGEGSFGYVQLARNTETGKLVAVKIFNKKDVAKYSAEEIEQLVKVGGGDHLIQYLGDAHWTTEDGSDKVYVFMQHAGFWDGDTAIYKAAKLEKTDPTAAKQLKNFMYKGYTEAVAELHRKGLFHHDIKPGNFVQTLVNSFLVDYGFVSEPVEIGGKGTELFVPPELGTEKYSSEKHDAFSLGITLLAIKLNGLPLKLESKKEDARCVVTKSNYLNINGESLDLSFSSKSGKRGRWRGLRLNNDKPILGNTIDEVIALLTLSDPDKRITVTEALELPFFKSNA